MNSGITFHLLPEMGADIAIGSPLAMLETVLVQCQASIGLGALNLPSEGSLKLPSFLLIPVIALMFGLAVCLMVMRERDRKK